MTIPRRLRLTARAEFRKVFERPVVSSDPWFRVLARRNDLTCSRLGLAVSRKVDRRAVQRNRIRRVVRESFRCHFTPERDARPADIVVLPRSAAVSLSNRQLREHLANQWRRIDERLAASG